jgi:hypothetical protein
MGSRLHFEKLATTAWFQRLFGSFTDRFISRSQLKASKITEQSGGQRPTVPPWSTPATFRGRTGSSTSFWIAVHAWPTALQHPWIEHRPLLEIMPHPVGEVGPVAALEALHLAFTAFSIARILWNSF